MLIADYLNIDCPEDLNRKWNHFHRTIEDYAKMLPNLTEEELLELESKLTDLPTDSLQRKKVVEYYFHLNQRG